MRLVAAHHVTALIAVPTMLEDMVAAVHSAAQGAVPSAAGADQGGAVAAHSLSSVLRLLVGGGGMRPRLAPLVRQLFPNAIVSSAYGMTEAASSITFLVPAGPGAVAQGDSFGVSTGGIGAVSGSSGSSSSDGGGSSSGIVSNHAACSRERASHGESGSCGGTQPVGTCVGAPAPGVLVAIAAPSNATPSSRPYQLACIGRAGHGGGSPLISHAGFAACSVVGEVLTCGPHVMLRYWGNPEQTSQVGRGTRRAA